MSELDDISSEKEGAIYDTAAKVTGEAKKNKNLNLMTFIHKEEDLIPFTGVNFNLLNSIIKLFAEFDGEATAKKYLNTLRDRITMYVSYGQTYVSGA